MSSDTATCHSLSTQTFSELIARGVLEIGDGYRAKNDELGGEGTIFLRAGHVRDTHINFEGVDRFQATDRTKFKGKLSQAGDVVVTTKGNSTGRVAFVNRDMPEFVYSPHLSFWRSRDESLLNQGFLRAWSRGPEFRSQLEAMSRSTDMAPYLSLTDQRQLRITIPGIDAQRAAAILMDTLDNRIALLRETNATLEAIAQALFKSWFVDFDPVHAKARGEEPEGLPEDLAALFPDSFEESPLGLVPRGWKVATIDDLCSQITNGGTPSRSKSEFWESGTIPWFKTGEFTDSVLLQSGEKITKAAVAGSSVKVLPENAVLMAIYAAPTVGRLGVLTAPAAFNQACTGMIAKPEIGTWFLFLTLLFGRNWFNSRANGAAQQNISKAIVSGYSVILPSKPVLAAFNDLATGLFSKIRAGSEQAQTLSSLRDTLLPRLISGQLRLPEVEEILATEMN